MARYKVEVAGRWIQPIRRGYKMACCDCGLTHRMNFRLARLGNKRFIQFQCFRDERATAAVRRHKKK